MGTAADTISSAPATGVDRDADLSNAKDVNLTLRINLSKHIQPRALTTLGYNGDGGVRVENADTFKFSNGFVSSAANSLSCLSNTGFYENREQTTLNGAINNSVTTIALTSAAQFPTAGTIVVGSEQITYTGKSGNNLTGCTRGADIQGTTSPAAHSNGAIVHHFKFISTNNYGYRIQDWGSITLDTIINYPGTKHNIPAPSEITIGKST